MKKIITFLILFISISTLGYTQIRESIDIIMEARKTNFKSLLGKKKFEDTASGTTVYKCNSTINGLLGRKSEINSIKNQSSFVTEFSSADYSYYEIEEVKNITNKLLDYFVELDKSGNYITESKVNKDDLSSFTIFDKSKRSIVMLLLKPRTNWTMIIFYGSEK